MYMAAATSHKMLIVKNKPTTMSNNAVLRCAVLSRSQPMSIVLWDCACQPVMQHLSSTPSVCDDNDTQRKRNCMAQG